VYQLFRHKIPVPVKFSEIELHTWKILALKNLQKYKDAEKAIETCINHYFSNAYKE